MNPTQAIAAATRAHIDARVAAEPLLQVMRGNLS